MRHAVYYAPPPNAELTGLAGAWLGRDAATGADCAIPPLLPPDEHRALVASPARYGFHATLKPPFRLAAGRDPETLAAAVDALAGNVAAVRIPVLSLRRLGPFFALVPAIDHADLSRLAARVVADLDAFRAPLTEREIERRRRTELTGPQEKNLLRWGYPWVMDEFRFHMTLTGPVEAAQAARVEEALMRHFEPVIGRSLTVDRLCVFVESGDGTPFVQSSAHAIRRRPDAGVLRMDAP